MSLREPPASRRVPLLTALGALLGVAGGGAAWVLISLIAWITNEALFGRGGTTLPSFATLERGPRLVMVAMAGGLLVSVLARWSPIIRGHGIPEAMESILLRGSRIAPRAVIAKPLSAAIAIGTGGPFGAEGPIIVTGGGLGSLIGQLIPASPAERKILFASGAAAGMSATFGAPLASVVLAFELLLFEFSARTLAPVATAAAVACGMHFLIFGTAPLFPVPAHGFVGLEALPAYAVIGLACGGLAIVVMRGLFLVEAGFRSLPVRELWHPVIGAAGFALVGLVVPRALGVGYDAIGDTVQGRLALSTAVALCVAKLLAWWVALGSGTSGGTLAPLLLIGGTFGVLVAGAVDAVAPGAIPAEGAAVAAMAATFGASTGATFTSVVFVVELTGDNRIVLPLLVATAVASLMAGRFSPETLMTEKLARRGLRVRHDYRRDVLATTLVRAVMTAPAQTIDADAPLSEVRDRFARGGHGAYPLVTAGGECVGIVSRSDMLRAVDEAGDTPVLPLATTRVLSVPPDASLAEALRLLLAGGVERLPVVDARGTLVGMCTRADVLRARRADLEEELRQPPAWLRRPAAERGAGG